MILAKEYIKEKAITYQTLYNWQKQNKIKLIKKDGRNYVVELLNDIEIELENEEFNTKLNDLKTKNSVLQEKTKELENENYRLQIDLKGKDYEIKGLHNQIDNLLRENSEKQNLIITLQQQMAELNKANILLLESKEQKEKRKKFLGIF